jgi:hypothetical protein
MRRNWQLFALGALVALIVGGWLTFLFLRPEPGDMVNAALSVARLAPLPPNAADRQKLAGEGKPFVTDIYLRFQTQAEALEAWLSQSPGLLGLEPQSFDTQRRYLAAPPDPQDARTLTAAGHTLFKLPSNAPVWWRPHLTHGGRVFALTLGSQLREGLLVLDDATQTVYLHIGLPAAE